ncbi:MAG: calcium-binding protein [Kiloniellales bacterium]
MAEKGMNQTAGQAAQIGAPAPGQTQVVSLSPGQVAALAFDPASVRLSWHDGDLIMTFPDGGVLRFESFAAAAATEAPPRLVLPDGAVVSGRQLLALAGDEAGEGTPLETAAGDAAADAPGAPPSGGASVYGEDLGDSAGLDGLDALGALTPDEADQGLSFDFLDVFTNHSPGLLLPDDAASPLATLDPPTGPLGDPGAPAGGTDPGAGGGAPAGGGQNNAGGGGGGGQGQGGGKTLTGTDGADTLKGGGGDDTLDGAGGDDLLKGGPGDDLLIGGAGDDQLQGGKGADIFLLDFAGGTANEGDDVVLDFDPAKGDALRFSNVLDADSDGADLDDVVAAIAGVQDDGSDVTVSFTGGGSVTLAGLGTGGIDGVAALLTVLGPDGIEVV